VHLSQCINVQANIYNKTGKSSEFLAVIASSRLASEKDDLIRDFKKGSEIPFVTLHGESTPMFFSFSLILETRCNSFRRVDPW
jgi:hypothetical protein